MTLIFLYNVAQLSNMQNILFTKIRIQLKNKLTYKHLKIHKQTKMQKVSHNRKSARCNTNSR